ncbi:MAG: hypothetical protein MRK02_08110 [Candidatus Scalindua sp.]|nr:hypothetical protein [Candidatus Scalindua sp.]
MTINKDVRAAKPVKREIGSELGVLLTQASRLAHNHKLDIAHEIDEVLETLKRQRSHTATFDGE